MKHSRFVSRFVLTMTLVPATGHADGVSFVRGEFAAGPERDAATDEASLRTAQRIFYRFELSNPGSPTQVRVQWSYDGRNLPSQTLDVGRSNRWRLWTILPRRAVGHTITVTVTDTAGTSLRTERLELR